MKKVEDFMAKDLPEIKENSPLKEIFEAFASSHHNILPVVNSVGKIVGVISLKEILNELLFSRAEVSILEKVPFFADFLTEQIEEMDYMLPLVLAKDVMKTDIFIVKEDDSMLKAALMMKKKGVQRFIVVNNDDVPVGYVSRNEVCRAFLI